jgi:membrane protein
VEKENQPMMARMRQFIETDIWRIRSRELPRTKSVWMRPLRIIVVSFHGFHADQCIFRASALTFYSLLSVVPIMAMAFGVAKGFGFERTLETELFATFRGQAELVEQFTVFVRSLLENTRSGVIAGVGVLLFFLTIIRVLGNIEDSFNHIWGIKKSRSLARKISDYLSAMLICPVLFILSSTTTVLIQSQVKLAVQRISLVGSISPAIFFTLNLLPYCVIWVLFTFVYMFMPNTKIKFSSGLFAGIVAGTLFQLFQWMCLSFQIAMAKYNAIYGSFAALPLFLMWLQVSWMIVLFGAEISFAHQNEEACEFEPDCSNVSYAFKRLLTLGVLHVLVEDFSKGGKPLSAVGIAKRVEIPMRLLRDILNELVGSELISEMSNNESGQALYQPAQDIGLFTIKYVIDRLEQHGSDNIPIAGSKELNRLSESLKAFGDLVEKSPANLLLKEI